jgi:predicted bacteriocin transport accessory protein
MKNFFIKVWEYIKKAFFVVVRFFKENVWASVLGIIIAIVLFIMALQGVIKAIDSCGDRSKIENRATVVTSKELQTMLDKDGEFILFIGSQNCDHCKLFYETINNYILTTGTEVFYFDTADTTDFGRTAMVSDLEFKLLNEIDPDRGITALATPTTVLIRDGEFVDAIQGAYGMDGGNDYFIFCEVVEGVYENKPTYTNKLSKKAE